MNVLVDLSNLVRALRVVRECDRLDLNYQSLLMQLEKGELNLEDFISSLERAIRDAGIVRSVSLQFGVRRDALQTLVTQLRESDLAQQKLEAEKEKLNTTQ